MRGASGLLSSVSGQGAGMAPQGFQGQEEVDEQPNVAPEEQQQYDEFVKNGMELLYTDEGEVQPEVLKRLSTGKKPIDTLAQTAVWLVMMLEQNAKQTGVEIPDDIVLHGGRELFGQLVEIDEAADVHKFKEAELQGAWYQALDMYREANSDEGDRIKPDEAAAAFEALNEADKEGRADEVVPGFYQQSEQAIAAAQQDQNDPSAEPEEEPKVLNQKATGRG